MMNVSLPTILPPAEGALAALPVAMGELGESFLAQLAALPGQGAVAQPALAAQGQALPSQAVAQPALPGLPAVPSQGAAPLLLVTALQQVAPAPQLDKGLVETALPDAVPANGNRRLPGGKILPVPALAPAALPEHAQAAEPAPLGQDRPAPRGRASHKAEGALAQAAPTITVEAAMPVQALVEPVPTAWVAPEAAALPDAPVDGLPESPQFQPSLLALQPHNFVAPAPPPLATLPASPPASTLQAAPGQLPAPAVAAEPQLPSGAPVATPPAPAAPVLASVSFSALATLQVLPPVRHEAAVLTLVAAPAGLVVPAVALAAVPVAKAGLARAPVVAEVNEGARTAPVAPAAAAPATPSAPLLPLEAPAAPLATSAALPAMAATGRDIDLTALVDRLVETRLAARAERPTLDLPHPDFGRVTLAVSLNADQLALDLPGAPAELRSAVSQAFAPPTRADAAATPAAPASAPAQNAADTSISSGGGQADRGFADARRHDRPEREQGQPQPGDRQDENRRRPHAGASGTAAQPAAATHRGVLA